MDLIVYVIIGEYLTRTDEGVRYVKKPLNVVMTLAQAQAEYQEYDRNPTWVPEGDEIGMVYFVERRVSLD